MAHEEEKNVYKNSKRRALLLTILLTVAIFIVSVYSLSVSNFEMTFAEAMRVVIDHLTGNIPDRSTDYPGWIRDVVVMDRTAPRTIGAILAGVILAVGGVVMQTVTRNPLTDPYTIGISSAAMLGYTISIVFGIGVIPMATGDLQSMANAFLFALIPSAVIVSISSFKRLSPIMMVLVGIGMMYMFSAFSTFIKFNASEEDLQTIFEWSVGTVSSVGWGDIPLMIIAAAGSLVLFTMISRSINVLNAGDKVAHSLGVDPVRLRIVCFVAISVVIAVLVCNTGTIGFVGLVAPHIARMLIGSDSRVLLPASAVIGAILVVVADTAVRVVPGGLPVGVITAIIGSPIFMYILYKQRKSASFRFRGCRHRYMPSWILQPTGRR